MTNIDGYPHPLPTNTAFTGMPGTIISTETFPIDRRHAAELHDLTHSYGADAAAIVLALRLELGIGIDRAIQLATIGDPAFRAACAAHLVTLRKEAAAERAAAAAAQLRADHGHQQNLLNADVDSAFASLRQLRAERELWEDMDRSGRAGPTGVSKEAYAARDAEIKATEKRLTRARKALETWEAAPDAKKSATYDQLTATKES